MTNEAKIDFRDQSALVENAGLIHRKFYDAIRKFLASDMNERARQRDSALAGLVNAKLLDDQECSDLQSLCEALRRPASSKSELLTAVQSLNSKHKDGSSSDHSRIIVGIAVDSVTNAAPDTAIAGRVTHADVEGAIVGGIFGFELGGGYGAAAGMILGGAASSIAEAS